MGVSRSLVRAAAGLLAAVTGALMPIAPVAALVPPPPNDNFAQAATISGQSGTWNGTNVGATCESYDEYDEPDHDDTMCDVSVWFKWTAPENGLLVLDTVGSAVDTILAVYTGNYLASLTWVMSNDDIDTSNDNFASRVGPFPVTKGQTYKIAVDAFEEGAVRLNWALHPLPEIAIGDASVVEGNSRARTLVFPVTLSEPGDYRVRFHYATANGNANTSDYTPASGDLSIAAGRTTTSISVPILGDSATEALETFKVNISGATYAKIVDSQGVGTIRNDDPLPGPRLTIGDATVQEGDSASRNVYLAVTLSGARSRDVTFRYSTSVGSATTRDFAGKSGTVTIPEGATGRLIAIGVSGDVSNEAHESFMVSLSNVTGVTVSRGVGTVTIRDDD